MMPLRLWIQSFSPLRYRRSAAALLAVAATVIGCNAFRHAASRAVALRHTIHAVMVLRGKAYCDYECDDDGVPLHDAELSKVSYLRKRLAPDYFSSIARIDLPAPRDVRDPEIDPYRLGDAEVAAVLRQVPHLKYLMLDSRVVTGDALTNLRYVPGLRGLALYCKEVHNADLSFVAGLRELRWLNLAGTTVTDGGVDYLCDLKSLRVTILPRTVSAAGASKLREALPECAIDRF